MKHYQIIKQVLTASALIAGISMSVSSYAGKAEAEYEHSYCKQEGASCGAVAYVNQGGYTVNWVRLTARGKSDQPNGHNAACLDLEKKLSTNLEIGEYVQFTVPTSCKYKIKIDIKSGEKKDKGLTLTPGCILVTKSAGTTTKNNKIKLKKRDFADGIPSEVEDYGEKYCKLD